MELVVNSRRKGKAGELEWAGMLRSHGYEARRGRQYKGSPESPDVVSELPFHWEVKRRERLKLHEAVEQARAESPQDKLAVVAHRRNDERWLVTMDADDFLSLCRIVDVVVAMEGE